MTSIPADPGLVLGNIVEPERIEHLKEIAQVQAPLDAANDRLNNLLRNTYKIQLIYQQMVNMQVDPLSLVEIQAEKVALKAETEKAAVDLAEQTMKTENEVRDLKAKSFKQIKISSQVESPLNYDQCAVKQFPLSFDSLKFDVQFFQVSSSADASTAHAASVSSHVSASFSGIPASPAYFAGATAHMGASAHATTMTQVSTNSVEGTIVITAYATHKQTDIISPFAMDAEKAVNAWNWCNPEEKLVTSPAKMWKAALEEKSKGNLNILSGVAKSSSFVGYVHVLKSERSIQSSTTASVAASVSASIDYGCMIYGISGKFGVSSELSSTVSSMLSAANLDSNCSIQCEGFMPSIVSNTIETTLQRMNPDPQAVMTQLAAIADASAVDASAGSGGGGGMLGMLGAMAGNARTGSQFKELNNSYITNVVSSLGEQTRLSNKVIDLNSMMTAFEDFVNKSIAGKGGVPSAFFIKEIKKSDVAKCFIRKFYPFGATNQKDAMDGQLGINSSGGGDAAS